MTDWLLDEELIQLAIRSVDYKLSQHATDPLLRVVTDDEFAREFLELHFDEIPTVRTNLPVVLNRYFEVSNNLGQLASMIKGHRWVSVCGEAGSGKSRIALQLAQDLAESGEYVGGVWMVTTGQRSIEEAMSRTLPASLAQLERAFILLDDLPAACGPELAAITDRYPQHQFLVTARQPFGLAAEQVFTLESVQGEQAIPLLQHMLSRLVPDIDRVRQLISLVPAKRLVGLPLALSLVAGCLASGTNFEITRSENGSLQNVVTVSVSTMSDAERNALVCMNLFSGEVPARDALFLFGSNGRTLISQLEQRGLIEPRQTAGETTYQIHDAIREEISSQSAPLETRQRFVTLFARKADEIKMLFGAFDWQLGTNRLFAQVDDFRTAIRMATEERDAVALRTFGEGILRSLFEARYIDDFLLLAQALNTVPELANDQQLQTQVLGLLGANEARHDRRSEAEGFWAQRLRLGRESGNRFVVADTLTDLAYHAFGNGEDEKCLSLLDEAEVASEEADSKELLATTYVIRARLYLRQGNLGLAEQWLESTERLEPSCHHKELMPFVYQSLAMAYTDLGEGERTMNLIYRLLRESMESHRSVQIGWALGELAKLAISDQDFVLAERCLVAAVQVFERYSSKHLAKAQRQLDEYRANYGAEPSMALLRQISWIEHVNVILAT